MRPLQNTQKNELNSFKIPKSLTIENSKLQDFEFAHKIKKTGSQVSIGTGSQFKRKSRLIRIKEQLKIREYYSGDFIVPLSADAAS
jgi:hypothetical protein